MAGIRKKGDAYYCTFRYYGRRYYFTVGNLSEKQAIAKGAEVDETLALLERGRLTLPKGVALEDFVAAAAKLRLALAAVGQPETVVGALCAELGITRQTLYRHVDPKGGLRPDGKKLLAARTTAAPALAYI